MRSRAGGSLVAGLGMAAILSVATAPPVIAEPDPSPTPSEETTAPDPSEDPAPDPSEDPTPDPSEDPTPDPSEDPTPDPSEDPTPDPSEDPTPDPSETPTPDPTQTTPGPGTGDPGGGDQAPAKPVLGLWVSTDSSSMKPGGSITATLKVTSAKATAHGTVVRLSASGASVSPPAQGMGSVGSGGRTAKATITAPANAKPGTIKLTATASASGAATVTKRFSLIVLTPSGSLPPGITLSSLPPDLPPLTPPPNDPMAGFPAFPQVTLPPVASPQIAPSVPVIGRSSSVALRANTYQEGFGIDDLAAIQAGWLAALATSSGLLLARVRLVRRGRPLPAYARRWLAGRPRTQARLRTIPPRPAPVPARAFWLPLSPKGAVRL